MTRCYETIKHFDLLELPMTHDKLFTSLIAAAKDIKTQNGNILYCGTMRFDWKAFNNQYILINKTTMPVLKYDPPKVPEYDDEPGEIPEEFLPEDDPVRIWWSKDLYVYMYMVYWDEKADKIKRVRGVVAAN